MRTQLHKSTKFHLNKFNFFAIPLMAFAGIITLGILAVNQDADPNASATNTTSITGTVSYDDEYITITNSANVDLGVMSVTADNTYAYASDNVTVSTNVPTGYELYVSSVNNSSAALTTANSDDKINATSGTGGELGTPATLDANSYGYAVASEQIGNTNFDASYASPTSSSKFAAIPAGHSDRLRTTNTAVTDGETTNVYYGASVNNAIVPGTYTGQVVYSAVATPTSGTVEMSVSPNQGSLVETLTITSGPTTINAASTLSTNEVEIYFRQNNTTIDACTVTNVNVSNNGITTTCITPKLSYNNTYDILITIPRYGFKDAILNGYKVTKNYQQLTVDMQNSNIANVCSTLTETTSSSNVHTYQIIDSRNSQPYYIRKFTLNGTKYCMMVENLYLEGNTQLTSDTSNLTTAYTLPQSGSRGYTIMQDGSRWRTTSSGNNDGSYYSWDVATAGTGGSYGTSQAANGADICPKYWHLPSYAEMSQLGNTSTSLFYTDANGATHSPILSGGVVNVGGGSSYCSDTSSKTNWWSNTQSTEYYAYQKQSSSTSYQTKTQAKFCGLSVRCLIQATQ